MKMWKLGLLCAAVLFTASINTNAFAQAGGGGGGGGRGFGQGRGGNFGPPTLSGLPLPYLTWALHLTDEQKTKVQAVQEKTRTDMQAAFAPDASGQRPDRTAMQAKMKEINDQAKSDVEAVLTDAQKKRTDAVLKEATIYNTVGIPLEVAPDLKLTGDQNKKLVEIGDAAAKDLAAIRKDMADARQAGDQQKSQELRTTMQAANKAVQEKALAVLTDEQKATIDKYNKEHPRRGPGGRAPGAGAGNA